MGRTRLGVVARLVGDASINRMLPFEAVDDQSNHKVSNADARFAQPMTLRAQLATKVDAHCSRADIECDGNTDCQLLDGLHRMRRNLQTSSRARWRDLYKEAEGSHVDRCLQFGADLGATLAQHSAIAADKRPLLLKPSPPGGIASRALRNRGEKLIRPLHATCALLAGGDTNPKWTADLAPAARIGQPCKQ